MTTAWISVLLGRTARGRNHELRLTVELAVGLRLGCCSCLSFPLSDSPRLLDGREQRSVPAAVTLEYRSEPTGCEIAEELSKPGRFIETE